mgnify:FL=1
MINWNDITPFDLDAIDPTRIDLTRFDLRNIELPKLPEMPDFELPEMPELPDFELPKLPEIDVPVDRMAGFARDAAYVGVGAVVVGAQKADERRREITDQVTSQVRRLVDSVA